MKDELISGGPGGSVSQHIYGHGGAYLVGGGIGLAVSYFNQGIDYLQRFQEGRTIAESQAEIADNRAGRAVAKAIKKAIRRRTKVRNNSSAIQEVEEQLRKDLRLILHK